MCTHNFGFFKLLFIYVRIGSSLLHAGFFQLCWLPLLQTSSSRAWAQQLWHMGLVAQVQLLRGMRDLPGPGIQTYVPCTGRQNHQGSSQNVVLISYCNMRDIDTTALKEEFIITPQRKGISYHTGSHGKAPESGGKSRKRTAWSALYCGFQEEQVRQGRQA